jgi:hypothetical protein
MSNHLVHTNSSLCSFDAEHFSSMFQENGESIIIATKNILFADDY